MMISPRRSVLYMPGDKANVLEKAKTLPADALIFDLEDAVAPEAKEDARSRVAAALAQGGFAPREIIIRINGFGAPWHFADLETAAALKPHAVLVPKVNGAADVRRLEEAMASVGLSASTKLWAMIETPLAVLNVAEIAAAAQHARLACLVLGTNDLSKDARAPMAPGRAAFQTALQATLLAGRAYGLDVIDGVFNGIGDLAGFEAEALQGRALGFDGKTLIHPEQIEPANRIFRPAESEIAYARAVIAAFAEPANAGKGVLKVEGRMTELLHLAEAKRLAALADAIAAREAAQNNSQQ